ncbi:energy transducer TonB [Gaetbulibacter aestuarii]|uniref:Energy transducer TonB n=1 Tax=Gaetbulibacter aestuarii TaxID=1502358 RepID=A0ABW7N0I2_9FLAO
MKKQNNGYDITRQSDETVTRSQKHDVNLQKNSTLYFQIGLILCLLMTFGLLEMRFETKTPETIINYDTVEPDYTIMPTVIIEKKQPKMEMSKKEEPKKSTHFTTEPKNTATDTPPVLDPEPEGPIAEPNLDGLEKEPTDPVDVPFISVQQVPVYPGCEKESTNAGRRQCMSDKITRLVQKKFDTDLAEGRGLSGRQVIYTQFTIDKTGHVTSIKTRAPHPDLEKEAERVIQLIPDMQPGKQRDTNVGVVYALPIVFQVQN